MIYTKKIYSIHLDKKYLFISLWFFLITIISNSLLAQAPLYLLELRNDVQVSATEYEFDIYLLRTGAIAFEYASGQYGIVINPLIKNGGIITASIVVDSPDPILVSSKQTPASVSFYDPTNVIRIAAKLPPGAGSGALISNISPGTRVCRLRLSNTVDFGQFKPNLTWTTSTIFPTQVYAYYGDPIENKAITNYSNHTTSNLSNSAFNLVTLSVDYRSDDPKFIVYPNPATEKINIDYKLVQNSHVRLSVFDINGKEVEQLINEIQQAGSYSVSWVPDSQAEGLYLVKLQTGMTQKISRVTLMR